MPDLYIYIYLRMHLYLLSLTFLRALTGWGRHPMHSDWIGRSQTTTVRSPTCRCTWIEVFRQRQIFGVLMFGRSCILYPILFYTIYYKHIERERERERDQLYSAGSFSTGLGHRLDSLVHLLCNFGRDPGAWRDSSRSVHLAINFANLASKPLVTPAAWIWHLDLRRASVLKMAETGSCAFSSTGQMSFCYISFII